MSADPLTAALAAALRPVVADAVREALAEHSANEAPAPALLTNDQVCAALQISRAGLHRLRAQGLPVVMIIESPRYDLAQVRAWLDAQAAVRRSEAGEHGAASARAGGAPC